MTYKNRTKIQLIGQFVIPDLKRTCYLTIGNGRQEISIKTYKYHAHIFHNQIQVRLSRFRPGFLPTIIGMFCSMEISNGMCFARPWRYQRCARLHSSSDIKRCAKLHSSSSWWLLDLFSSCRVVWPQRAATAALQKRSPSQLRQDLNVQQLCQDFEFLRVIQN